MATEASLARQTADEIEGSKVVENAKIVDDNSIPQSEQTAGCETAKDIVEEQENSETTDNKDTTESNDEASATREVKKEDKDDNHEMAPTSGTLGDKEDAPLVNEVKTETQNSEALIDINDGASAGENVKKDIVTSEAPCLSDAGVETSARDPEEKSVGTTDSLSDAVEKTLLDPTLCSVQELEKVGESEVSEPVVEVAKSIEEPMVVSSNLDLSLESVVKSEEHSVAVSNTEPAPDAVEELERKNETAEADDMIEVSKAENIAMVEAETEPQLLNEESVGDAGSSSQSLDKVPDDSIEAKAIEVVKSSVLKNTENLGDDVNTRGFLAEAYDEHNAAENLGKEVVNDTSLPNPPIAVDESEAVGIVSVTDAAETGMTLDTSFGEQKAEKTVDMDLIKEQKEAKLVTEVVTEVNAGGCTAESKNEESEQDATEDLGKEVIIDTVAPIPVGETEAVDTASVTDAAETALKPEMSIEEHKEERTVELNLVEDDKIVSEVITEVNASGLSMETKNEEGEHDATEGLGNDVLVGTSFAAPSSFVGETEPILTSLVTKDAEIALKPETDIEEQNGEATVEKNFIKEQKEEETVGEEPAKEEDGEKTMEMEPDPIAIKETAASFEEEKPCEGADKVLEQRDLGVSDSAVQSAENLKIEEAPRVPGKLAEEPKPENENVEDNKTLAFSDLDQSGPATSVSQASSGEEKAVDCANVVVEERDLGFSSSAAESAEAKQKTSDVTGGFEEHRHENENIEDVKTLTQTSRDIDLGGQIDTSAREAPKSEAEKSDVDASEKDETEKKIESEKHDAQDFVESSKDADSKVNLEAQKAEASAKPSKTLLSKVKHSIVKVKKAIIGKSPSSKAMSSESKDELKVK